MSNVNELTPEGSAPPSAPAEHEADRAEAALRLALGRRIREARRRRNLTGQKLARLVGVTPSFVSQIELGQVTPSISTVFRIIHVLGITVGDLFDTKRPAHGQVINEEDWDIYPYGISEDAVLALDPQERLEVIWSRFAPGATSPEPTAHNADVQVVFVLRGQIELQIGDTQHVLRERSCITFDGRLPHYWFNRTSEPTEVLSIHTPAV
jgi:transcriptional regulator with XRE-family HTH domain